jgi:hypothetical protein
MSQIRLLLLFLAPTLACGGAWITEEVDLDGVLSGEDLEDVREQPDDAARCDAACLVLLDAELGHGYESSEVRSCEAVGVDPSLDPWEPAQAEVTVMCTVEYTWDHGHY